MFDNTFGSDKMVCGLYRFDTGLITLSVQIRWFVVYTGLITLSVQIRWFVVYTGLITLSVQIRWFVV